MKREKKIQEEKKISFGNSHNEETKEKGARGIKVWVSNRHATTKEGGGGGDPSAIVRSFSRQSWELRRGHDTWKNKSRIIVAEIHQSIVLP